MFPKGLEDNKTGTYFSAWAAATAQHLSNVSVLDSAGSAVMFAISVYLFIGVNHQHLRRIARKFSAK